MRKTRWLCPAIILISLLFLMVLSTGYSTDPISCNSIRPDNFPGTFAPTSKIEAISNTIEDEKGCRSILTVDCFTETWEGGDYEIDYFVINLDGKEWYSSDTAIHGNSYRKHLIKDVACYQKYTLDTKAGISWANKEHHILTATKQVVVPPLGAKLEYKLEDIPGESGSYKRYKLIVNYEGSDLTNDKDSPMTHVQLMGNGELWSQSLSKSNRPLNPYRDGYERVVTAGQIYQLEVVVTDEEGSKYTYSKTVTIPRDAYMLTVKCSLGGQVILSSPRGQYKVSPGKSDSGPVIPGTEVSLTAYPETGYIFSSWSGDLTGAQNPAAITMDRDKAITAHFVAAPQKIVPPSTAIPGAICPKCGKPVNQCTCR